MASHKNNINNFMLSDSDTDSDVDNKNNFTITELFNKTSELHKNNYVNKNQKNNIDDISTNEQNLTKHNLEYAKRILCFNVLNKGFCDYNDKCAYAHGLTDQKIEPIRKEAYDMIKKDLDLSKVDLLSNRGLLHNLNQLTKLCRACVKGVCPGGYNCKYGAFDKRYQICYNDLNDGDCHGECDKVHLTDKGLIPYNLQKMKSSNNSYTYKFIKSGLRNIIKEPIFAPFPTKILKDFSPQRGELLKLIPKQIINISDNDFNDNSDDSESDTLDLFIDKLKKIKDTKFNEADDISISDSDDEITNFLNNLQENEVLFKW